MGTQLLQSIIVGDFRIVSVLIGETIAPVGAVAFDIVGDNARLVVGSRGAVLAEDPGNTAIQVSGDRVRVTNSGVVFGDFNGIVSTGNDFSFTNSGVISSNSRAVNLAGGDGADILNFGSILGTGDQRNGTIYGDGDVDDVLIQNFGVVDAGVGNDGDAISWQVGDAAEDALAENIIIINEGLLAGRGQPAGDNGSSGIRFFAGDSPDGQATVIGSITNSGVISSEALSGVFGGIVFEAGVGFVGTITNEATGVITAPNNGINLENAVYDLTIDNFGLIESDSRAVNLDGDNVTLNNQGNILGTDDQRNGTVYLDGPADNHTINNLTDGVIDAGAGNDGSGISWELGTDADGSAEVSGNITNDGVIQGRGVDNVPAGIRFFVEDGLAEATFTGNITNFSNGVIASEQEAGILLEAGVVFNGVITNDGAIVGGNGLAINASGALGQIDVINNGTLIGDVQLGDGQDSFVQNSSEAIAVNGGADNDILTGGSGNDLLTGETGNDTLTGNGGSDTFVLSEGAGSDTITDFENGVDLISLVDLAFSDLTIASSGVNTLISVTTTSELLATLNNIDASLISGADFLV